MQIGKGERNERLAVSAGGGAVPMLRAEVPLPSALADLLASGGEPLMVRLDDGPPLVLPPSPLIGDYLRSCTTARPLPVNQGGTAGNQVGGNQQVGNSAAPAPSAPVNGAAPAPAANAAQPR
jgi:hypothetical protein